MQTSRVLQEHERGDVSILGWVHTADGREPDVRKRPAPTARSLHSRLMHISTAPSILYFGTPVVVVSTLNEDDTPNLAPISSVFWLGWRCVIGVAAISKTTENLIRTGECVLNLASESMAPGVDNIALTTGSEPVPPTKQVRGYRHVKDKFRKAGWSSQPADLVRPPRVRECPAQLEARLEAVYEVGANNAAVQGRSLMAELRVLRAHMSPSILHAERPDHVDPDKWRPLIMSFQKFYGLGSQLQPSRLSSVPEGLYRTVEVPTE